MVGRSLPRVLVAYEVALSIRALGDAMAVIGAAYEADAWLAG